MLELYPSLEEEPRCRVEELYPEGRRPGQTLRRGPASDEG